MIRGDEGGRSLLLRAPEAVRLVEMAQPDEAFDVDAPEDYQRIAAGDQMAGG
jgi:CTP:molybdopterin cytidylyltransferase MocA